MTEIALRQQPPPPMSLPDKLAYCEALARAGALPKSYRGRAADVLFAVEYAESLGLHPIVAITGVHVVEGTPSASAGLISMLVRRAGHRLRVSGDAQSATCEIVRADDPDYTFSVTWTMDDAQRAGLQGKDNWRKYPASMLKARAVSQCARDAAEDALFGLHYTPEEAGAVVDQDGNPVEVEPDRPVPPAPRPPAPVPTGRSGDRYDSPQQSAPQNPAAPVAPVAPEPMPGDLRDLLLPPMPDDLRALLLAAWSDLDIEEVRKVWQLCGERGVEREHPTADDQGQPTTVQALFSYAGRRILEGERPAGADQPAEPEVVDGAVVLEGAIDAPLAREQQRAERLPEVPADDPWYGDQPAPAADGLHPMDLPLAEPDAHPSMRHPSERAREAARKATRRAPASTR